VIPVYEEFLEVVALELDVKKIFDRETRPGLFVEGMRLKDFLHDLTASKSLSLETHRLHLTIYFLTHGVGLKQIDQCRSEFCIESDEVAGIGQFPKRLFINLIEPYVRLVWAPGGALDPGVTSVFQERN